MKRLVVFAIAVFLVSTIATACGKKPAPVARPTTPPTTTDIDPQRREPPRPPTPIEEPVTVPPDPAPTSAPLGESHPLKPVFYELDSSDVSPMGQQVLQENAQLLRQNPAWHVTIEGHCDERGTPEYNLALGERRAIAARDYLVSLGIPVARVKTVSYGKEFPFEPGHTDASWSANRRAHFVVSAK